MKTTYESETILEEINKLISLSCQSDHAKSERFKPMHRALIKKYFNASEVSINDQEQCIIMKVQLDNKEYATTQYKCSNLEGFLKSCIKKDADSLRFYENMLTYYNLSSKVA